MKSTHQEKKFLVAESALLGLFNVCVNCVNKAQGHNNHRKRTFINIILLLILFWNVIFVITRDPWIANPSLDSFQLETCSFHPLFCLLEPFPHKLWEFLNSWKWPTPTQTFSICTKRYYLQPTITHFWKKNQGSYFEEVRHGGCSITAGDGRAGTIKQTTDMPLTASFWKLIKKWHEKLRHQENTITAVHILILIFIQWISFLYWNICSC